MKKLYFLLSLIIPFIILFGCQKMDDSFKQFIIKGGHTYPGKPTSLIAQSGNKRIKISWLKGSDPSVTKAKIYWNNYQDSLELAIPEKSDTITTIIDGLPEKQYTFEIITYNKKGDKSIPAEVLGTSYGEIYQESLLDRPINQVTVNDEGVTTILWGAANTTDGAYATEVTYTDSTNQQITRRFPILEEKTVLSDKKDGNALKYRTVYLPDSLAIDTFYTTLQIYQNFLFDKSTWKVIDYSTEHDNSADNRVENIIDGNPATRWHAWLNSSYPHYVVIDMQKSRNITAFEIFRMKDDDRACDRFELAVSNDNINWKILGDYDFNRLSNAGQMYSFESLPQSRYFKFTGIAGPQNYMVMGEISVYGY